MRLQSSLVLVEQRLVAGATYGKVVHFLVQGVQATDDALFHMVQPVAKLQDYLGVRLAVRHVIPHSIPFLWLSQHPCL